ncbi:hypothetical protein HU200_033383 [Digitaria exilis]|uniref:Uncharacterized protein n=1 Tax=Digitaria exilis TaxID=1010633 RepID=A0A835BSC2_9POAL|nr:hypothetical protein HU200_033383 [Digitaria exilis]
MKWEYWAFTRWISSFSAPF